jgi:hypothetical protein
VYAFNHFHLNSGEGLHLVIGVPNKRNDCVWLIEPIGLRLAQLRRCPRNIKILGVAIAGKRVNYLLTIFRLLSPRSEI